MNIQGLWEAFVDADDRYVDPMEPFLDADGGWLLLERGQREAGLPGFNEHFLAEIRAYCRALAATNEFAINAQENRINYVIGQGHKYQVVARHCGHEALAVSVQEVIEAFMRRNRWHRRQAEILRRRDRDGEAFLRLFRDAEGSLSIRFVEPDQVTTPEAYRDQSGMSFGIHTETDDVETVHGFWIDGVYVPADEIQHRKSNVDANVKRGLPLFYPVRKNLRRAEKLLRNMSVVAEIQSAIALIRKHKSASGDSVRRYVQGQSEGTLVDPARGKTEYRQRFSPGTIVDAYGGVDYEFPIAAIDAGRYIQILQAELRAIAARLVMPEFMLTSDASNANYSSTMIAEGPAVRMFERLQQEMIEEDIELFQRVVAASVAAGRLPADALRHVRIKAVPPTLAVRDRYKETLADRVLLDMGVVSRETLALRYGGELDEE